MHKCRGGDGGAESIGFNPPELSDQRKFSRNREHT
jgi:hypothetical protein